MSWSGQAAAEGGDDHLVQSADADHGVGRVDDGAPGGVQSGQDGADRGTAQLLPLKGFSTLGSALARFPARTQACYRAPGSYPDRTFTGRRRRAPDQVMTTGDHLLLSGRTRCSISVAALLILSDAGIVRARHRARCGEKPPSG